MKRLLLGVVAGAGLLAGLGAAPASAAPPFVQPVQYWGYGPGPDRGGYWREREWRHHEWERHRRWEERRRWHEWHDRW
jgi:hypothetical protein